MFSNPVVLAFYVIVNAIAIAMAWLAWRRPDRGRFLFGGMFLFAGVFNLLYSTGDPEEYIYYSDFAFLEGYRKFILGTFTEHLRIYLTLIAVGQLLVAAGLFFGKGRILQAAAIGGILFLLAIAPLGVAAAFPATLIMALGCWFIFRKGAESSLFAEWGERRRSRKG